jgi:glycosyltransferase involved in cell wall biosynthesis
VVVAAARLGVPVVMTVHNYRLACANALLYRGGAPCRLCVDGSAFNGVLHRCYRGLGPSLVAAAGVGVHRSLGTWRRSVDLFLALTGFARRLLIEGGLPDDRVVVKPNFVPDPGPRPAPPSSSSTVLFAGRLSEEKGIGVLLEAWRRSPPAGLELVVIGDGPLAGAVGGPGVRFLGRLAGEELGRLMLTARALLVPSQWYEGMPMVVLEAFAAGLPVLAGAIGGLESIVGEAGEEWLVSPPATGWKDALVRLGSDAAVDRGSELVRELYERRYDPGSALRGLEDAYRRVLG